jgi:hypothetical protein
MVISFLVYRLLSFIIGIVYPSYQTYKSLKYQYDDHYRSLLSYWIVLSLFGIYEHVFDPIISFVVPFYYELKLIFLFWLAYRNLSDFIFEHFLRIVIDTYEHDIDYFLNNTVHRLTDIIARSLTFILHRRHRQQSNTTIVDNSKNSHRLKTNFASQYRRIHSVQSS